MLVKAELVKTEGNVKVVVKDFRRLREWLWSLLLIQAEFVKGTCDGEFVLVISSHIFFSSLQFSFSF